MREAIRFAQIGRGFRESWDFYETPQLMGNA